MKKPMGFSSSWRDRVLDLIFPRACQHCGGMVEEDAPWQYLCRECAGRLDWVFPPFCDTCGHPFAGIDAGRRCAHCDALNPVFSSGRCCVLHREVGATLVRALKYGRAEYLLRDLGRLVQQLPHLHPYVADAVLVPVPLHPTRERERGFNQSARLAQVWAQVLPVKGWDPLLRRPRWTGSQTRLARTQRRKNIRGAFALRSGAIVTPDLTYLLVDDVFTTGSTINECCRVLRQAGATDLRVLTLAHG